MVPPEVLVFQKGWNFRQDGPGHRLVWHLQGCNLHCPWCSNPEGLDARGTLLVDPARLVPEVCPEGAIHDGALDRAVCARCAERVCLGARRNLGVRLSARTCTVPALVAEAAASRALFHSGGGVTLSGGEPTVQLEGARALLLALREAGIDTALETNGTHPRLPELFPLVDTLILDLKHHDPARMAAVTGGRAEVALANLRAAAERHPRLWVRVTLVPGFNASEGDLAAYATLLAALPRERLAVEVLGYHLWGRRKWDAAGRPYDASLPGAPVAAEVVAAAEAALAARGLPLLRA